jgi:hypothetical protein
MRLLLLEALGALLLLLLIVWWTMFSGRDKGELRAPTEEADPAKGSAENPSSLDVPKQVGQLNR